LPGRDLGDLAQVLARKAAGDEAALVKLADDHEVPDDVLGFHAQQAVEKLIKAVLANGGVEYPRVHDIAYLIVVLQDHGIEAPPDVPKLEALTPWGANLRYEEVREATLNRGEAVAAVEAVRRWAEALLAA
jgi:HEPN domain-containing protein